MDYICSDTNVWIDFSVIGKLELPFRLSYTYLMSRDAVEDELLSPPGLGRELVSNGLVPVEITIDEFLLAETYGTKYRRLSIYDRIALAIAKCRNITLLTGDGALRKAAKQEGVSVTGTLGLLDQLWGQKLMTVEEYQTTLMSLLDVNNGVVRLPEAELELRLSKLLNAQTDIRRSGTHTATATLDRFNWQGESYPEIIKQA